MEEVVQYISKHEVNTLETLLLEGLDSGEEISDVLRETWNKDVDDRRASFHDQLKNRKFNVICNAKCEFGIFARRAMVDQARLGLCYQ